MSLLGSLLMSSDLITNRFQELGQARRTYKTLKEASNIPATQVVLGHIQFLNRQWSFQPPGVFFTHRRVGPTERTAPPQAPPSFLYRSLEKAGPSSTCPVRSDRAAVFLLSIWICYLPPVDSGTPPLLSPDHCPTQKQEHGHWQKQVRYSQKQHLLLTVNLEKPLQADRRDLWSSMDTVLTFLLSFL